MNPSAATLLLLTVEDLSVEQLSQMRSLPVQALAVLGGRNAWDRIALSDGLARAAQVWPEAALVGDVSAADISEIAIAHGCSQIATAFLPVGPVAASIAPQRAAFAEHGLEFAELLRDWDRRSWPHCRKGFFALKEKIPALVQEKAPS